MVRILSENFTFQSGAPASTDPAALQGVSDFVAAGIDPDNAGTQYLGVLTQPEALGGEKEMDAFRIASDDDGCP